MIIKLASIKDVSVDPMMERCPVGSKFSQGKYVFADICIYHEGIPNSKAYFNSEVLKAALLSNPELLEEVGLKVIDLDEEIKKGLDEDEYVPDEVKQVDQSAEVPAVETETAEAFEPIDYSVMDYPTLVKYAREQGMEFTTNPKKVDILEYLKSKE